MVALAVRSEGSLLSKATNRSGGEHGNRLGFCSYRLGVHGAACHIGAVRLAQAQTPDISGIYWATQYHAKIQLVGGGDLPLTPKGKAEYEKNMAGPKDGSITEAARTFCVPDGLPRVLATPYPFEIIQAPPGQVTIIHELTTRFASSPWANRCRR